MLRNFLICLGLAAALGLAALVLVGGSLAHSFLSAQTTATAAPTALAYRALGPTKFARRLPTETPIPTRTSTRAPSPTAPSTATATRIPTRVRTPTPTHPPTVANTSTPISTATPQVLGADILAGPSSCAPIPSESYGALPIVSAPTDRPAESHPDLNLALRGYARTEAFLGLIDLEGATEPVSPQLAGLVRNGPTPAFLNLYQVYDWNWATNTRGDLITDPPVTLAGLGVTSGQAIYLPDAGANIGQGYQALVLYGGANRITLKYTGEDNVERGYTLHLEGVCVEPRLLALYQQLNAAGRGQLPALRAGQAIGRASSGELGVAIRDSGTFMDPRSRKDWWRGE